LLNIVIIWKNWCSS